jgi:hypothetical protein
MILMKFVSKVVVFNKIKKPGGPPKEFHGPLEGRGPPVEKHWSRAVVSNVGTSEAHNFRFKKF